MQYQQEQRAQNWRAVAVFQDRPEQLLYLGLSCQQVRAGLAASFFETFDEEERAQVTSIALQRWTGTPDLGKWQQTGTVAVPEARVLAAAAAA